METIAPLAKVLAEANGIEWRTLHGTGDAGLITEQDILGYLARVMSGEEDAPLTPVDPEPSPAELAAYSSPEMLSRAGVEADLTDFMKLHAAQVAAAPPPSETADFELDDEIEPAKIEPAKIEPVAAEADHDAVPLAAEYVETGPVHTEPVVHEPVHIEPAHTEPTYTEPTYTEPAAAQAPVPTPEPITPPPPFTMPPAAVPAAAAAGGGLLGGLLSSLYRNKGDKSADKAAADRVAADKVAADKLAADKLAADKAAADHAAEVAAAEHAAVDKVAAEHAAAEKAAAEHAATEHAAAEAQIAADKAAAEHEAAQRAAAEAERMAAGKAVADQAVVTHAEPVPVLPVPVLGEVTVPEVHAPAAAAAMPAAAAWSGTYLRRDVDLVAMQDAQSQLADVLGESVPAALLVARAAQRHLGLLKLSGVAVANAQGQALSTELGGELRSAVKALHGAQTGSAQSNGADLLILDAGALDLDDLHYPHAVTLSLGRVSNGRAALSLNGDVDAAQGARFLAEVAALLATPVKLLV
ncbi:E3 binding domain-containing protein [Deinococcus sp.]|uniref:E3 binding domain-containing protein n=1 Tax=Deinococcus sp. TaxID=47478 RepID=UPI0026003AD4|nr:E3 binding domain-containing protein [Deinococcus sp.]